MSMRIGLSLALVLGFFGAFRLWQEGRLQAASVLMCGLIGLVLVARIVYRRRLNRLEALNSEGIALMRQGRHVEALSRFDAIQPRTDRGALP